MSLDPLMACAGNWTGTNELQDPENNIAEQCTTTLALTPVARNRFVRLDYTWSYKGDPQEGSLLIGVDPKSGRAVASWIDTWHMGYDVMACKGSMEDNTLSVLGSYAAPEGPDWGWRIDVSAGDRTLTVTMYNIHPSGKEDLAVTATYERP